MKLDKNIQKTSGPDRSCTQVCNKQECWMSGRMQVPNGWGYCQECNCFFQTCYCPKNLLFSQQLHSLHLSFKRLRWLKSPPESTEQLSLSYTILFFTPLPWICPVWAVLSLYTESIHPEDFSDSLLSGFTAISIGKTSLYTEHQHLEATKRIHKVCMFGICLTCQYKPTGIQNHSKKHHAIHRTSHTMDSTESKVNCAYPIGWNKLNPFQIIMNQLITDKVHISFMCCKNGWINQIIWCTI